MVDRRKTADELCGLQYSLANVVTSLSIRGQLEEFVGQFSSFCGRFLAESHKVLINDAINMRQPFLLARFGDVTKVAHTPIQGSSHIVSIVLSSLSVNPLRRNRVSSVTRPGYHAGYASALRK